MTQNTTPAQRSRLAAVITAYKRLLHGQHVVDRFLDGYGWAGTFTIRRWTWYRSTSISAVRAI